MRGSNFINRGAAKAVRAVSGRKATRGLQTPRAAKLAGKGTTKAKVAHKLSPQGSDAPKG